jgi:NitT/TauT family transport system substrate-binding protein
LKEAGVDDARLVAVGPATSGYPQVLDAQLAASWSRPPANVGYLLAGEIRIIARANDSPQVRNQTTRVNAVNVDFLASRRAAVIGFLKAYKKSVDWAYSSPLALDAYARLSGQSSDAAKYVFQELTSREGAQIDQIKGEDRVLAEALAAKRIPHALTHEDIEGLYDFVAR